MDGESKNVGIDDEVNGFSLIDFSIADDSFLVPASEASKNDVMGGMLADKFQLLLLPESLEPEKHTRQDSCNLRKSLAWDSAFFTSAGVLDPEELSCIIEGAEVGRGQKQLLPRINEDLSKSTESISTFESDSLSLECLEADFFSDIRASIQRSSKDSNQGITGNTAGSCETEGDDSLRSKTVESTSGNMVKPKSGSNKLNTSVQGWSKTTKIGSASLQPSVRGRGSSFLVSKHREVAQNASSIATHAANKRMPVSASCFKSDIGAAVNVKVAGRRTLVPRVPCGGDSNGDAPNKTIPVRSSSGVLSLRSSIGTSIVQKAGIPSCHSCDSSTSSSETKSNCMSNVDQNKLERTITIPSSAKLKNPSLVSSKNKSVPGHPPRTTLVKSTTKIPSNVSPVSSVSECSTESSSSMVAVNRKHASSKGFSTYCSGEEMDGCSLQKQARNKNQVTGLPAKSAQRSSAATGPCARAASAKPSGLRLPSPKIGFFDGAKAGGKAPNGGLLSHPVIPSNVARSDAASRSPGGSSTKQSLGNMAAKISPSPTGKPKVDTPNISERIKQAVSPGDKSITAEKTPQAGNGENYSGITSGYRDISVEAKTQFPPKSSNDSETKRTEMPVSRKSVAELGSSGRKKSTADYLKSKKFTVVKTRINKTPENSKLSTPNSSSGIKEAVQRMEESSSSSENGNEAQKFSEIQNEVQNKVSPNFGGECHADQSEGVPECIGEYGSSARKSSRRVAFEEKTPDGNSSPKDNHGAAATEGKSAGDNVEGKNACSSVDL